MITGYILVYLKFWNLTAWMMISMLYTGMECLNFVRAVAIAYAFKATQIWPDQQTVHSQTRGWKKKTKNQIFALCQEERDKCSVLGSLFLHSGVSVLPFSSPAPLEYKESAHLPISTSSAPAGWQAGSFPGYSSAWKRDLEKPGSCIPFAGGQGLPLCMGRKHQGAMRMWAPKCLSRGLPRLVLL